MLSLCLGVGSSDVGGGGGIFESPREDQVGRGSPRRLLGGINPALRGGTSGIAKDHFALLKRPNPPLTEIFLTSLIDSVYFTPYLSFVSTRTC